jgi:predicted transposase YbfD/YdcC
MLHEEKTVIAQHRIPDETTETTQVRELLEPVDPENAMVTADAAHARRETAEYIAGSKDDGNRESDYFLFVKGNQPSPQRAIYDAVQHDGPREPDHTEVDYGHGRIICRSIWVTDAGNLDFPHAARVARIRRDGYDITGTPISKEIVHAVTSLDEGRASAADLARIARGQRGIESVHWLRDTAYAEDANTGYAGNGPQVMATFRNLTVSLPYLAGVTQITRTLRPSDATEPECSTTYRYEAHITNDFADPVELTLGLQSRAAPSPKCIYRWRTDCTYSPRRAVDCRHHEVRHVATIPSRHRDGSTMELRASSGCLVGLGALLQLDLRVGCMLRSMARPDGLAQPGYSVAFDGHTVGLFDGAEAGGYPGLAGGDGLAVASAVGAFGQALAELLDLADVGLALVSVRGNGEHDGIGGGGIQDEADRLALEVAVGQGDYLGPVGLRPGLFGEGEALPGPLVEFCQHQVGPVELVAGGAEVLADRPEMDAAADAVVHEPGGLGVVRIVAGARVDAQLSLERLADRSGLDEVDQAPGEDRCLRPGCQPDRQPPAVTWSTVLPLLSAAAIPSSMRGSYMDSSGSSPSSGGRPAHTAAGAVPLSVLRMCLASQSAASRSGCLSACSCWRLMSLGGWDAAASASGPVRPSSAAQPWMCGQSR